MTIVDTKVTRISLRSRRRNAFDVEVEVEAKAGPESKSNPRKPTTKSRETTQ
jgi:hypothetical protein